MLIISVSLTVLYLTQVSVLKFAVNLSVILGGYGYRRLGTFPRILYSIFVSHFE